MCDHPLVFPSPLQAYRIGKKNSLVKVSLLVTGGRGYWGHYMSSCFSCSDSLLSDKWNSASRPWARPRQRGTQFSGCHAFMFEARPLSMELGLYGAAKGNFFSNVAYEDGTDLAIEGEK